MEKATADVAGGKEGSKRRRGSKRDKLAVTAEVVLEGVAAGGSRFLGYEDILIQDLRIVVETVRYRLERVGWDRGASGSWRRCRPASWAAMGGASAVHRRWTLPGGR